MKLSSESEVTSFLNDFGKVIEKIAAQDHVELKTFDHHGKSIFVDPLKKSELLFLIQIYNEVAVTVNPVIDLDEIFNEKLCANDLAGVNTELLNPDITELFRRYDMIKPEHEKKSLDFFNLTGNETEQDAKKPRISYARSHQFFLQPRYELMRDDNGKDYDVVYVKPNFHMNVFSKTEQFTIPRLGEKNCFSYEDRLADYERTIADTRKAVRLSQFQSNLLFLASTAVILGSIGASIFLFTIAPPITFALIILGGLIAIGAGCAIGYKSAMFSQRAKIELSTADLMTDVATAKERFESSQSTLKM